MGPYVPPLMSPTSLRHGTYFWGLPNSRNMRHATVQTHYTAKLPRCEFFSAPHVPPTAPAQVKISLELLEYPANSGSAICHLPAPRRARTKHIFTCHFLLRSSCPGQGILLSDLQSWWPGSSISNFFFHSYF